MRIKINLAILFFFKITKKINDIDNNNYNSLIEKGNQDLSKLGPLILD